MNEGISRQASVADVARAAGVAKATAARVLGGYGIVSAKTRAAVEAAADRLGYRPNELARSMTTGRTGTVGVVVGDIGNPFFSLAVRGISDRLKSAGFGVILANSGEDVEEERAAIRRLLAWRVDGIIVSPASVIETAHIAEALDSGVAVTLLDRSVDGLGADSATTNDTAVISDLTRELIRRGHRRLVYVTSSQPEGGRFIGPETIHTGAVRKRIEGFLSVCAELGLQGRVVTGATNEAAISNPIAALMSGPDRPDAIVASDSLIGLSIFLSMKAAGVAIGRDVSLVTFYNADWTEVTDPPVAVVGQQARLMGLAAANLLIERLASPSLPVRHVEVAAELIWRASVRAGPIAG